MSVTRSSKAPTSILKKPKESSSEKDAKRSRAKGPVKLATASTEKASAAPRGTKRDRVVEKAVSQPKIEASTKPSKSKKTKTAAVEPVEVVVEKSAAAEESDGEEAAALESESDSDGEDDDGEILHGLSDLSDADSSDQDDDDGSIGEITKSGVVKLPSSRDDAVVKLRLDNAHKKKKESGKSSTPIVLYFGRVPKSMPEEPLRTYLSQFGDISRLRLSRNRKTGASKHYAFVEFQDEEVGQIVQETMNNYLLEGRLLQVRIIPKDKVHPGLWVGANRKWRKVPEARRFRVSHDAAKQPEERERVQRKLLKRQEQRRTRIKAQGIDYDFDGYVRKSWRWCDSSAFADHRALWQA